MNQIFVLSLPRSGSTLLQRLISCSNEVETTNESWLFLGWNVFLGNCTHTKSDFGYATYKERVKSLLDRANLEAVYKAINNVNQTLLADHLRPDAKYFLEKTPRNFLALDTIDKLCPNSKKIFLVRDPLEILESYKKHFASDKISKFDYFNIDLPSGFNILCNYYRRNQNAVLPICYSALVDDPKGSIAKLEKFLELDDIYTNYEMNGLTMIERGLGDKDREKNIGIRKQATGKIDLFEKTLYRKILKQIDSDYFSILGVCKKEYLSVFAKRKVKISLQGFRDYIEYRIRSKARVLLK